MADLLTDKFDYQSYPITNVGVGYFGPFEVEFLRISMKRWCCFVTCLTTRPVHIKLVQSIDTDSHFVAMKKDYYSTWRANNHLDLQKS